MVGWGWNITAKNDGGRKSNRQKVVRTGKKCRIKDMKPKYKINLGLLRPSSRKTGKWEGKGGGKL